MSTAHANFLKPVRIDKDKGMFENSNMYVGLRLPHQYVIQQFELLFVYDSQVSLEVTQRISDQNWRIKLQTKLH